MNGWRNRRKRYRKKETEELHRKKKEREGEYLNGKIMLLFEMISERILNENSSLFDHLVVHSGKLRGVPCVQLFDAIEIISES